MSTLKRYTNGNWEVVGAPVKGGSGATLAYAQVTSAQTGLTGSNKNLTGLAATVTVPSGRRIRITGFVPQFSRTGGTANYVNLKIMENPTDPIGLVTIQPANLYAGGMVSTVISPSAGSHTYRLAVDLDAGATVDLVPTPSYPAYILIEDISDSVMPYNASSIPVGVLAQSAYGLAVTTFSTVVDVPGSTLNVVVPSGRLLKITAEGRFGNNVTAGHIVGRILEDGVEVGRFNNSDVTAGWTLQAGNSILRSPSAGSHTYKLTVEKFNGGNTSTLDQGFIFIEDVTPTPATSTGAPGSTLGYAEIRATQGSVTSEVDITGLSVTVTVPVGRRLRLKSVVPMRSTNVGVRLDTNIKEGGTVLQRGFRVTAAASLADTIVTSVVVTPSAGTHTYKVSAANVGAGTATVDAGADYPAYLIVEDITGSVWPAGSSVTNGMIASEAWTDYAPTFGNFSLGNGLVRARYMKIGRTVHYQGWVQFGTTSSITGDLTVSIPYPVFSSGTPVPQYIGTARAEGAGFSRTIGDSEIYFPVWGNNVHLASSGNTGWATTVPFSWTNGNVFVWGITYEAVS